MPQNVQIPLRQTMFCSFLHMLKILLLGQGRFRFQKVVQFLEDGYIMVSDVLKHLFYKWRNHKYATSGCGHQVKFVRFPRRETHPTLYPAMQTRPT